MITHFHLDHWGDLVPWTFGAMFGPGRETPKPQLWLPPGGDAELEVFEGEPGTVRVAYPYFPGPEPVKEEPEGSYAVPEAFLTVPGYEWYHSFSEIVDALITEDQASRLAAEETDAL